MRGTGEGEEEVVRKEDRIGPVVAHEDAQRLDRRRTGRVTWGCRPLLLGRGLIVAYQPVPVRPASDVTGTTFVTHTHAGTHARTRAHMGRYGLKGRQAIGMWERLGRTQGKAPAHLTDASERSIMLRTEQPRLQTSLGGVGSWGTPSRPIPASGGG